MVVCRDTHLLFWGWEGFGRCVVESGGVLCGSASPRQGGVTGTRTTLCAKFGEAGDGGGKGGLVEMK